MRSFFIYASQLFFRKVKNSERRFIMFEKEDILREDAKEDNEKNSSDSKQKEKRKTSSPWSKEDKKKNRRPGWFSSEK